MCLILCHLMAIVPEKDSRHYLGMSISKLVIDGDSFICLRPLFTHLIWVTPNKFPSVSEGKIVLVNRQDI